MDRLEQIVREGAERLLAEMLEFELDEFLQRLRYQRGQVFKGYRNGYAPARSIGVGMGRVTVRAPRVSDVPHEVAPEGFHSQVIGRYQRVSRTTQRLLARLYLEGLSTGDFEPVFRAILGENSPLGSVGSGVARDQAAAVLEPPHDQRAEQATEVVMGAGTRRSARGNPGRDAPGVQRALGGYCRLAANFHRI